MRLATTKTGEANQLTIAMEPSTVVGARVLWASTVWRMKVLLERGGWTEHDYELLKDWAMLDTTDTLKTIMGVVELSESVRKVITIKQWRI